MRVFVLLGRLGLAICHEIVQAAGGTLSLDNLTDSGHVARLAVSMHLPLADNTT